MYGLRVISTVWSYVELCLQIPPWGFNTPTPGMKPLPHIPYLGSLREGLWPPAQAFCRGILWGQSPWGCISKHWVPDPGGACRSGRGCVLPALAALRMQLRFLRADHCNLELWGLYLLCGPQHSYPRSQAQVPWATGHCELWWTGSARTCGRLWALSWAL
jgi:hypothetical protein